MGVRRALMATSQAFVLILVFSYLICSTNAIPATRLGGIMHKIPRVNLHLLDQDTTMMKDEKRRMVAELDDYPGFGANSRHTPRAAFAHACSDC